MADHDQPVGLLVVVIDTNPVWWGQQLMKTDRDISFTQCMDSLLVFCNSHLMLSHKNKLAIIAAHANSSKFLYPRRAVSDDTTSEDGDSTARGERDGKYELFAEVDSTLHDEIKDLVFNDHSGDLHSDCLLAGAMSMGLCYVHRVIKELPNGETIAPRMLIVKSSEDHASQYMNFMNVVFSAQKLGVVIDACILDNESGLLQQACDITDGTYLKIPQLNGLLQYLLWIFLPDSKTRSKLTLPHRFKVDYRAACFCHRQLIDIGYICSICLSIFCNFSPICATCNSTFKIMGPPKALMKKKVKR